MGPRPLASADALFGAHMMLARHTTREGMGEGHVHEGSGTVIRAVTGVRGMSALAFLRERQACALVLGGEGARRRFGNGVRWRFLETVDGDVREFVGRYGRNGCVIELQSVGNVDFAVVDLFGQPRLNGEPDGMLLVGAGGGRSWPVGYMARLERSELDRYVAEGMVQGRWGDQNLASALQVLTGEEELLRLGRSGFVMETREGGSETRRAVVLQGGAIGVFRVCTAAELAERYGEDVGLIGLSGVADWEIAIRALPGTWHEETRAEVAAYAFCW